MERFEVIKKLGEGVYGNVYMAVDKESGVVVAIKCFKAHPELDIASLVHREASLLKAAKHPNVVQLRDPVHTAPDGRMFLVTEFVDFTLKDHLRGQPEGHGMPETSAKLMMWQILQGTAYLHLSKIIHRDLTPSNILVSASGIVKLCDFGFARSVNPGDGIGKYTPYITTRWYRPPELLVGAPYGPPADVWAIGCLFAEMMTGHPVFPGQDILDQLSLIAKAVGPLPDWQMNGRADDRGRPAIRATAPEEACTLEQRYPSFSQPMMQVLKACLHPDPRRRLSAREVLSLPYWDDIHKHIRGTELQQVYDAAYSAALSRGSASAPCLWASSTSCLEARAFNVMLDAESIEAAEEGVGETRSAGWEAGHLEPAPSPAVTEAYATAPEVVNARPGSYTTPAAAAPEACVAARPVGPGAAAAPREACLGRAVSILFSVPLPKQLSSYCSSDSEPGRPAEEPGHASHASSARSNRSAVGSLALGGLSLSVRAAAEHGQHGGGPGADADRSSGDVAARASKRGTSVYDGDMFASAPQAIRPNKVGKVHAYALAGSLPTLGCMMPSFLGNSAHSEGRASILGGSMDQRPPSFLLGTSHPDSRTRINRR